METNEGPGTGGPEDGLEDPPLPGQRLHPGIPLAIALAALLVVAGLPKALGLGWFGARQWASQRVSLHVLNTAGRDLYVEADLTRRLYATAGRIETTQTFTGPNVLRVLELDGTEVSRHAIDIRGQVLVNAQGSECLAVVDISSFYGGGGSQRLELVARVPKEQEIVPIETEQVVLPRRQFPDQARIPIHWIETTDCRMLDPALEEDLLVNLFARMRARRESEQERRALQER